ncbi:MAG: hypothetical protein D3907_07315 [Candidatus Electrothrix sp. AUS3]|nr:hypothetical protein [Candidatus Electrothrix gigas]
MFQNKTQVSGNKNVIGKNVQIQNFLSTGDKGKNLIKYFKRFDRKINKLAPRQIISPCHNNQEIDFSTSKLIRSLFIIGIPVEAIIFILDNFYNEFEMAIRTAKKIKT